MLEAEIKRLEAEYNMFFAGRLPRLPWETRARVEELVKRYDRMHMPNTAQRFRFGTLQARFAVVLRVVGTAAQGQGRGPAEPARRARRRSRRRRATPPAAGLHRRSRRERVDDGHEHLRIRCAQTRSS